MKKCFIEYSKTAVNVTSRVCRTPLVKVNDQVTARMIMLLLARIVMRVARRSAELIMNQVTLTTL